MSSPPPPSVLPAWPPTLSPAQLDHLLTLATSHALGHGFTLLPLALTTPPTAAIPAPLSLLPTPFPRTLYHRAVALQTLYNALYVEVARDEAFLDEVMGGSVARVDAFQGELWRCWKACRADLVQPLQLGLFRSDYLLHEEEGGGGLAIKQVEFNTISSSFGALSQMAGAMHRYGRPFTAHAIRLISNASQVPHRRHILLWRLAAPLPRQLSRKHVPHLARSGPRGGPPRIRRRYRQGALCRAGRRAQRV